ncbi:hypothetical protein BCR42DRAFT_399224 [Absidia repens]|uniref:SH3 domain-containing protein n=1 Tax=Absidia repens TaxID=90262 RepID=A0A1X2IZN6_9FUNG|nr:hypothetical protein BCR42DRAFT_399224 [Absidia repens]
MTDPHHNPLANHMLMSIQKDLAVLKDQKILDETTYQNIITLLPTQASSPSPVTSNTIRPPLPTRKSTTHSPNLAPIPAPRTPSFPKLPVRRTSDLPHQQPQQTNITNTTTTTTTTREPLTTEPSILHQQPSTAPPPPSYNATVKNKQMAEAIYDYAGEDPSTDLSFRKGDMIEVTEHVNDDWWRGSLKGKSGIFPQNHVQSVPPQKQASPIVQVTKASVPTPHAYPTPPTPMNNHYQQQQQPYAYPPPPTMVYHQAPSQGASTSYNYVPPPMAVAAGGSNNNGAVAVDDKGNGEGGSKVQGMAKKFGSNLGNAVVFGAGATIGSEAVHAIF